VHTAWNPQEPWQGLVHLLRTQAKLVGQSELMTHSGLQLGGAPNIPGVHEHTARESITRHSELAPQGEGTQGLTALGGSTLGAEAGFL